jgi:hypothetical protein
MPGYFTRIDPAIVVFASGIGLLFIGLLVAAAWQAFSAVRELRTVTAVLERVPAVPTTKRAAGQTLDAWDRLQQVAERLPARARGWWPAVGESVEKYTSAEGLDGYFITQPVEAVLTEDVVLHSYYRAAGFHHVPGILTSLGLLGTFLALLFGLSGLHVRADNSIVGIQNLIENLSGKFLTSVVALGLSVLFLLFDLYAFQPAIRRRRATLVSVLAARLPYLTPSRILLDIQRASLKQARSLSNISSEFIGKFTEVFHSDLAPMFAQGISSAMATQLQSEMGPTLERLSSTMAELTGTVQRLEASKQESVVGQLRGLTESLEHSLRTTLGEMGAQFRDALSASTRDEFGQLAGVVQGSAGVLQAMTTNFASMESTLRTIVEESRSSTSAQMTASVEQTERLNQMVEGLMVRLNSAASQNFESVGAVLTTIVGRLSDRVGELSEDLVATVHAATRDSREAANATLEQAGTWTAQTGAQLQDLLATLKAKSVDFERAGDTLLAAERTLEQTLAQSNTALVALGQASGEVRAYTTSLAGLQRQVEDGQKTQLSLATLAQESVAKLTSATARQDELLERYRATVEQYQRLYTGLDQELDRTLSTILTKMDAYTKGVERSFEAVMRTANQHFPDIASTLQDANDRLRQQLDDFTEVLETNTTKLKSA